MMTGATAIVLFLFAMTSSLEGSQLRSCVEEDVCSAIIFNQLTIATMKDDMRELMLSLNNVRNKGEKVPKEELSGCHIRNKHLKKQILSLQRTTEAQKEVLEEENRRLEEEIIQKDQQIQDSDQDSADEKEELRLEVEDLWRSNQAQRNSLDDLRRRHEAQRNSLEEANSLLQQAIIQRDELIKNLTILAHKPVDCAEIQIQGRTESGIYTIYPYQTEESIDVLCDLDSHGGGWTVFFTRQPQDQLLDFNESWEKFKNGFGDLNTEYWLGMNCALGSAYAKWGKGGWWYKGCGSARLTAPLKNSNSWDSSCYQNWNTEGNSLVSFKTLSMKFRRHNYEERVVRE